jgi:hypothetical protein
MIYYIIIYIISIIVLGIALAKIKSNIASKAIYYSFNIVLLVPSSYYIASNFFSIKENYISLALSTLALVILGLFGSLLLSKQILRYIKS